MTPAPAFPEDMRERVERWLAARMNGLAVADMEDALRWALERDAEATRLKGSMAAHFEREHSRNWRDIVESAEAKLAEAENVAQNARAQEAAARELLRDAEGETAEARRERDALEAKLAAGRAEAERWENGESTIGPLMTAGMRAAAEAIRRAME